ncbi:excinuclease ABC subunit UvrC [Veillonella sp. YH-vei2232]|uniref:UvrABC system protein C n=1 Tax=Veillonella absiana TaxID=3079305 RepID=A0ABU3Z8K1_9FIRM|nr:MULTISPECIES: excinuclease ABC subunit UvrC [unclassified Veillonella]MDV5062955.1 excinuclease ABC subunit UvrC [Veillonella sp. YH-vei2232]MDV5088234.1 excinuclease ABC subunit UvrC [Veillonella sp. YH-vei2233]
MVSEELLEKVSHLPTTPGVYLWHDKYNRIIYVGKAINLRNRVRSYVRQDANRAPKVTAMMRRAVDVEIIQTKTEMEALILENTLIKEHHPKYNIMLRDDKTYPYIKVSVQEDFPRVYMTRRMERDGAKYFGPFTDVTAVHQVLKLLYLYYPLRTCRSMKVDRPCLQYHMHYCEAPCVGLVKAEKYRTYIDEVMQLFEGKHTPLLDTIQKKMEDAAEQLEFEQAARYRDQLTSIGKIQEKQRMVTQRGDLDVLGIAMEGNLACVQLLFIRGGRLLGRENYFVNTEGDEAEIIMTEFIKQYYGSTTFIPKELLLPMESSEQQLFTEWFTDMKGQNVDISVPQRGYKKDMINMAHENAQTFLNERRRQWQHEIDKTGGAVKRLAEVLDLPRLPERMECFDISHTQGAETVASMVVFEGGKPAKKEYRRFKLKTTQGKPDDFKSMAEIMERRYGNETDWPMPDLIVIDGGKGQLNAALPLIRQVGVVDVPVISLAKRIEEVFVEGKSDSIILSHHTPELQLLQQIRDEAHRFAITYHRKLRGKRNLESILDHIEGIGPKRRQALWKEFGTLEKMKEASVEELEQVESMNRKSAQTLYNFFRMSKAEKQEVLRP